MSKIKTTVFKSNDQAILGVELSLTVPNITYEYCIIKFKCGDTHLSSLSTSSGNIDRDGDVVSKDKNITIHVEYCDDNNILECLVGYYSEKELLYHEVLSSSFDNTKNISNVVVTIPFIRTIPGTYEKRYTDFFEALKRYKSSWEFEVSFSDEVILKSKRKGKDINLISFGEKSQELKHTDFVFRADPNVDTTIVPTSIIESKFKDYEIGSELCVSLLIRPDFLNGVFYKFPISNIIPLGSFTL